MAIVGGFILSIVFKFLPEWGVDLSWLGASGFAFPNAAGVYEIPFMDRMGFVFLYCTAVIFITGIINPSNRGLIIETSMFRTSRGFAIGAAIVFATLVTLYTVFW